MGGNCILYISSLTQILWIRSSQRPFVFVFSLSHSHFVSIFDCMSSTFSILRFALSVTGPCSAVYIYFLFDISGSLSPILMHIGPFDLVSFIAPTGGTINYCIGSYIIFSYHFGLVFGVWSCPCTFSLLPVLLGTLNKNLNVYRRDKKQLMWNKSNY